MKNFSFKSFVSGILVSSFILVPVLSFASNTKTIEAVFGKVKLLVNGVNIDSETLLYNNTTYLPIRALGDAIGAEVNYNANTYTAALTTSDSTYWANKVYILATPNTSVGADKLIISNVTGNSFDFEFKYKEESVISGTALISEYTASCKISDIYGFTFEIHGDEITVSETGKAQLFPDSTATYVHKTSMNTENNNSFEETKPDENLYTDFKTGTYSGGSSDTAKTLVISNITEKNFKYQVISSNGKDVVTEGIAAIISMGKAECIFTDTYKITLTSLKNNVIQLEESEQKLFPYGGLSFYITN